jgi:hypothetical protein
MEKQDVLKKYRKKLENRTETVKDFKESGNAEMMNASKIMESDREELAIIVESLEESISRKTAHWIDRTDRRRRWLECSGCGIEITPMFLKLNYCPVCGAKMDNPQSEA